MNFKNMCYATFLVKKKLDEKLYIVDFGNKTHPDRNNVMPILSEKVLQENLVYFSSLELVPHARTIAKVIGTTFNTKSVLGSCCIVHGSYEDGYLYLDDSMDRIVANMPNSKLDDKKRMYIGQFSAMLNSKYTPHIELIGVNHNARTIK